MDGDKVLTVEGKQVTLKDLGRTEGGRHRLKAQFYVSGIGQIFLTAYASEKEVDVQPARRGRPPGSPNKTNKAMAEQLAKLQEEIAALKPKPEVIVPPPPSKESRIAALQAELNSLSAGQ